MVDPILTILVTIVVSFFLFWGAWKHNRKILLPIQISILFSLISTGIYNAHHNPHHIMWLCNITAVLALMLTIHHHQKLWDIFFYFAWTGDLFTLLIWPNPLAPPLETNPWSWAGFILKHTAPLALSILIIRQGKLLSKNAAITAIKTMLIYTGFIMIYNLAFNQNILDLRYATLEIEQMFGEWPIYVLVNILLALCWYYFIYKITIRLKLV